MIARIERGLQAAVELPTAALVLVEIFVLLAGVISRFVFHHPFVWSDELASILFLWLAMLGAVVALQRMQHMRLTAVVGRFSGTAGEYADVLSIALPALFLAILLPIACEYALDEYYIETPALGWSNIVRAGAIPVGAALMLVSCLLRLMRFRPKALAAVAAALAAIALVLWVGAPLFKAMGNWNLVFFFVVLLAAGVLLGVPIGFAFGTATLVFLMTVTKVPLTIVVSRMDEGMSGLVLLAVPLFVFLGLLIDMTGMARAMVAFLAGLLGHVRGGLYYVLLGAMYLVSGISGSKAADMAAVAPILFPEMQRRGAHPGELSSLLATSSAMSETIPPSLVLIIVGAVTGVSISALFTGGLLPAGIAAAGLALLVFFRTRADQRQAAQANAREIGRLFVVALPALVLPFIIRYAVLAGVTTATEVATVGVVYSVLIGLFVYRCFDRRRLFPILVETAALSGAILLIVGSASAMAWSLTQAGFAQTLTEMMTSLPGGRAGFLAVSVVLFVVLGSVLEGLPAMVLFGPLLFPAAQQLGIHLVQYGIVAILAMGIGLFAPPFGVGFYQTCLIGKVSSDEAFVRIWPYLAVLVVALIVVAAVPWISTGFLG